MYTMYCTTDLIFVLNRVSANVDFITSNKVPVTVEEAKIEEYEERLTYVGGVTSDSIQTLAFKSSGKIEAIYVEIGQKVDESTLLISLDTQDIDFAVRASENAMLAAKAQYVEALEGTRSQDIEMARVAKEKAEEVSRFKADTLIEISALYEAGFASSKEVDGANLESTIAMRDYQNALAIYSKAMEGPTEETLDALQNRYEQAKVGYEMNLSLLADSQLYSSTKGTVVNIVYEENEMLAAGYPAIVVRKENQVINMGGVTDEDLEELELNQKVYIYATDDANKSQETIGFITRIADVPDMTTHLYQVEVAIDAQSKLSVGEVVTCEVAIGKCTGGVDIPLKAVTVDDKNYVYVVHNEATASKKYVDIVMLLGHRIIVEGLEAGDKIITQNIPKLYEGKDVVLQD